MEREITKSEVDLVVRKIGSTSIPVGVEDLLGLLDSLDSAARYLLNRDSMNAALHLESVRRSPLTTLRQRRKIPRSQFPSSPTTAMRMAIRSPSRSSQLQTAS